MNQLEDFSRRALPGIWLGLVMALGLVAAPSAFAHLPKTEAGLLVKELFSSEANISLAFGAVLLLLEQRESRRLVRNTEALRFTLNMGLVLGSLMATLVGYYVLQPWMSDARRGMGSLSFAQLHAISFGFYALKLGLISVLAYRSTRLIDQSPP